MEDRYLFKAKDCNSIWRAGLLIGLQEGRCAIEEKDGSKWACNSKTICQCTGLKDKNGKLIWENDIVKTNNGRLCKVFWFSSSLYQGYDLKPIESENPAPTKWNIWYDIEVIGNIFDNPELINE